MEGFVDGISVSGDTLGDAEASLISGDVPKTKFNAAADGEAHLLLNQQRPDEKRQKLRFWTEIFRRKFF